MYTVPHTTPFISRRNGRSFFGQTCILITHNIHNNSYINTNFNPNCNHSHHYHCQYSLTGSYNTKYDPHHSLCSNQ